MVKWNVKISVKTKQKTNRPPTTVIGVINRIRNSSVPCGDWSLSMHIHGKSWHSLKTCPSMSALLRVGNLMLHSNKGGKKTFSKRKKGERKARDVVCERNEAHSKGHGLTCAALPGKWQEHTAGDQTTLAFNLECFSSRVTFRLSF